MSALWNKISEYPVNLYSGTHEARRMTADDGVRRKDNLPAITRNDNISSKQSSRGFMNTQQNFSTTKSSLNALERNAHTSSQKHINPISQDIGGILNLNSERKIFVKKGRMLSSGYFLIEISRTESTFYIAAIK